MRGSLPRRGFRRCGRMAGWSRWAASQAPPNAGGEGPYHLEGGCRSRNEIQNQHARPRIRIRGRRRRRAEPLPETVTDPPRENVVGDTLMVTLTTVKAMLALFGGEALSVTVIVVAPKAVPLGISKVRFSWPKNVVAVLDGVTATVPSV